MYENDSYFYDCVDRCALTLAMRRSLFEELNIIWGVFTRLGSFDLRSSCMKSFRNSSNGFCGILYTYMFVL